MEEPEHKFILMNTKAPGKVKVTVEVTAKVKICDKSYLIHAEIRILILFEMKSRDISSSSVVCCSLSSSLQSKQQLEKFSIVNSVI